jgi:hypothetical protein
MRNVATRFGVGAMVAVVGLAPSQAVSGAEPEGQKVRYTLTSATGVRFNVNYLTAQPPSKEAYNADPYAFLKREQVSTAAPWVFETTLQDPQWATIDASAAAHGGQGEPFPRCEIAVDGQVVVEHADRYTARCMLSNW